MTKCVNGVIGAIGSIAMLGLSTDVLNVEYTTCINGKEVVEHKNISPVSDEYMNLTVCDELNNVPVGSKITATYIFGDTRPQGIERQSGIRLLDMDENTFGVDEFGVPRMIMELIVEDDFEFIFNFI